MLEIKKCKASRTSFISHKINPALFPLGIAMLLYSITITKSRIQNSELNYLRMKNTIMFSPTQLPRCLQRMEITVHLKVWWHIDLCGRISVLSMHEPAVY